MAQDYDANQRMLIWVSHNLGTMDSSEQDIVNWRFVEGLDYGIIGDKLGISEEESKLLAYSALRNLQRKVFPPR